MIERIIPTIRLDEPSSAFCRGVQERPLRVTFHTSSFVDLPTAEGEAIEALLQLAHLPEIDALETEPGIFPYLEIGIPRDDGLYIPVTIRKENVTTESGVKFPNQLLRIAAQLVGQNDTEHLEVQSMFADITVARAHCEMGRDILVTLSSKILEHRAESFIRKSNPRTPLEAAQIVGLFLRSRGNYTYFASQNGRRTFDHGLFYLVLARHRLPSMWRYFSACVQAEKVRRDDILYLGQSILVRCVRALEARDAVGIQFYLPQDNNTRDAMMYHFDYLTLLLSGAFDALARIAHRAYGINQPKNERHASFRKKDFRNALKNNGASDLYNLVSEQYFQDVMTLLYEPRNTIHGAGLPTLAAGLEEESEASFVTVLPQYQTALWEASERCGSTNHWGLVRLHRMCFEPYTYSVALVGASLELVDAIAKATDVERLFPSGHAIPILLNGPPKDSPFREVNRRRLAILG